MFGIRRGHVGSDAPEALLTPHKEITGFNCVVCAMLVKVPGMCSVVVSVACTSQELFALKLAGPSSRALTF